MSDTLTWQDDATGARLPVSTIYGDSYYSRHDGRAEARHVFLAGNGLPERWAGVPRFTIGELGFGTGLNVLEAWALWRDTRAADAQLLIQSVERHPLDKTEALEAFSRWPGLMEDAAHLWSLDNANGAVMLDEQTILHVHHTDAATALPRFEPCDAWFLDGFSPDRNPDMWSPELMAAVFERSAAGGTFATYTAAGWVRRNLQAAGFSVERQPGFGHKRHMSAGRVA